MHSSPTPQCKLQCNIPKLCYPRWLLKVPYVQTIWLCGLSTGTSVLPSLVRVLGIGVTFSVYVKTMVDKPSPNLLQTYSKRFLNVYKTFYKNVLVNLLQTFSPKPGRERLQTFAKRLLLAGVVLNSISPIVSKHIPRCLTAPSLYWLQMATVVMATVVIAINPEPPFLSFLYFVITIVQGLIYLYSYTRLSISDLGIYTHFWSKDDSCTTQQITVYTV